MDQEGSQSSPQSWSEWIRERDHPSAAAGKPEALDDLVVLDLSVANMAGLVCSSFLSEFGAEVIRVEPPGGDPARGFAPFGLAHNGTGLGYLNEARNKHHVTLNLESAEGREIFRDLAAHADVIIESFLPGAMDAWEIGYRQLSAAHPHLIYCGIATYGQYGPRAAHHIPDSDMVAQALSGITYVTGLPDRGDGDPAAIPTKQGNWHGWFVGGIWAAFGVLAALHHQVETGRGQFVDLSPAEALMRSGDYSVGLLKLAGRVRERMGNLDAGAFPYTYVRCKDGYCFLSGFVDINWQALCAIMDRPDLRDKYPTVAERSRPDNQPKIHAELEAWATQFTYEEIQHKIQVYDRTVGKGAVATGKITEPHEVVQVENWWEREALRIVEDPHYGELLVAPPVPRMTRTPPRLKWVCRPVGADNSLVYARFLGYGRDGLMDLRARGIV
jgi:crotonobetainyl-CoA:carnitine CoA-transferase CaiB-like acyl-CoA transferase